METIAAVATGTGEAGIGVIRISGPNALAVGDKVFRPTRGGSLLGHRSRVLTHGWVVSDEVPVDEGLAVMMPGPLSFTGEDIVELHCHGGAVAVRRVLQTVLAAGARLAEPGEYTRRAFVNGRMDLSQAESVIDIIRAKTDRAMEAAVGRLRGGVRIIVQGVRDRLLEAMSHLEADIEFPELNLETETLEAVGQVCEGAAAELRGLVKGTRQGKLLRDGLRVTLIGRPNVGKSSLMNRLVKANRSIVTDTPGTTRDVVEEWITLLGIPVVFADTAGIRSSEDPVERLGVERSQDALRRSDIVLVVVAAEVGITPADEELWSLVPVTAQAFFVANKIDLCSGSTEYWIGPQGQRVPVVGVSALTGSGLAELESRLSMAVEVTDTEEVLLASVRQEEAVQRAIDHIEAALHTKLVGFGSDLISIDLRSAWSSLGEVTGDTVGEDLLDQIFSRFCIGK